jgi:phosphoglucosamine mutase
MLEKGLILGGEQSGHIIFLKYNTTGDGLVTSLQLLGTMIRAGKPLSELKKRVTKYPQLLENVRVKKKEQWERNENITKVVAYYQQQLGEKGRIFVRASGTEPLIRVMAEGPDQKVLNTMVKEIAAVIKEELT